MSKWNPWNWSPKARRDISNDPKLSLSSRSPEPGSEISPGASSGDDSPPRLVKTQQDSESAQQRNPAPSRSHNKARGRRQSQPSPRLPETRHQASRSEDKTGRSQSISKHRQAELERQTDQLQKMRNEDQATFHRILRERELELKSLRMTLEEERKYREKAEKDNDNLRTSIVDMSDSGPVHSDDYYFSQLDSLNQVTKSWAAKAVKAQHKESSWVMSDAEAISITQALEKFPQGRSVTAMIRASNNSINAIAKDAGCLVALVRQLTWLYLFELIFKPFCFGLRSDVSHLLYNAIQSTCLNGTEFTNVLLIHQAVGRGILEQIQPNQNEKKRRVIETLAKILSMIFPTREDVGRKVENFVDLSVALANKMTGEKGLFCGSMIAAGEPFNCSSMDSFDDPQNKRVYMCTFPMFAKMVIKEGQESLVYLSKANVEHEGLFHHSHAVGSS